MMKYLLVWYPKCTTCQKAEKWLRERGAAFETRDIKALPPSVAELSAWQAASGFALKRFFNTSGLVYRALGLSAKMDALSDSEKLALLASDGMLVKRPILVGGKGVAVGFREADWAKLLDE